MLTHTQNYVKISKACSVVLGREPNRRSDSRVRDLSPDSTILSRQDKSRTIKYGVASMEAA